MSLEARVAPPCPSSPRPEHAPGPAPGAFLRFRPPAPRPPPPAAPTPPSAAAAVSPLSFAPSRLLASPEDPQLRAHTFGVFFLGHQTTRVSRSRTPMGPEQPGSFGRRSGSYSNGKPEVWICGRKRKSRWESSAEAPGSRRWWGSGPRGAAACEQGAGAGGSSERRPFPASRASGHRAPSTRADVHVRCDMDTPPLSGSDSDSDDSLVTDREVGVGRARGAGRGRGSSFPRC